MKKKGEKNCKHWHEDTFYYDLKEICKANGRIVTCSGVKGQCDYPLCFEEIEK